MTGPGLVVAVPAAVAAACCFGVASYLQARASHQAPARRPGDPALFWDLLHRGVFPAAIGMSITGFGLQVLALRYGTVLLVQPLLVLGLLVYVLLAARLAGGGPTKRCSSVPFWRWRGCQRSC